jgi:hypothetical protein
LKPITILGNIADDYDSSLAISNLMKSSCEKIQNEIHDAREMMKRINEVVASCEAQASQKQAAGVSKKKPKK